VTRMHRSQYLSGKWPLFALAALFNVIRSRVRVLLITGSFPPMKCGVGDYTASLAEALSELPDVQVVVLTTQGGGVGDRKNNFRVFPLVINWNLNALRHVLRVIRDWHPDIVHIQYPTQGYGANWLPWFLPVFLRVMRITQVHTWHEFLPMGCHRHSALIALCCDGVIVVRPRYKESTPSFYRWLVRNRPFEFIPNASALPVATLTEGERTIARRRFVTGDVKLVAFFGFIYPHKGVEDLFQIADPEKHHLVIIGSCDEADSYHRLILDRVRNGAWKGNATVTGFLPADQAAKILAASDAVILPFRQGGGLWNTSLHGAVIQGSFVLTTSHVQHGYDSTRNIYFARPGDIGEMRQALRAHIGQRSLQVTQATYAACASWPEIATSHAAMYRAVLR
jgi:glycosyltransferase involved in cell wall biosynthesis